MEIFGHGGLMIGLIEDIPQTALRTPSEPRPAMPASVSCHICRVPRGPRRLSDARGFRRLLVRIRNRGRSPLPQKATKGPLSSERRTPGTLAFDVADSAVRQHWLPTTCARGHVSRP